MWVVEWYGVLCGRGIVVGAWLDGYVTEYLGGFVYIGVIGIVYEYIARYITIKSRRSDDAGSIESWRMLFDGYITAVDNKAGAIESIDIGIEFLDGYIAIHMVDLEQWFGVAGYDVQ
jgi:hypothetical protein